MSLSKKEFLREKFTNFKAFIESKAPENLEITDDVKNFQSMNEEELVHFAITYLIPYKNSIDYPTKVICEMFQLDFKNKSVSLIVANYLELFISLIS
jgi:hypothetical protein